MTKIAIIGSAPSSVQLAPYADPTWQIWACSPGAWPHVKRADAWFEVHRREPHQPWFSAEYIQFLATKINGPVYVAEPWPEIPNAVVIDPHDLMDHVYGHMVDSNGVKQPLTFGPYVWGSTLSYMLAKAIARKPAEIGIWGVDMSAEEEWQSQRDHCQTLIWIAKQCGIKVYLPPESDLIRPTAPYGFRETDPMHIKLITRENELTQRVQALDQQLHALNNERQFVAGALSNTRYALKTWTAKNRQLELAEWQPQYGMEKLYFSSTPELTAAIGAGKKVRANGGVEDRAEL